MTQLGGVPEARIEDGANGRTPSDAGWWVLNLGEIAWARLEGGGTWCEFESPAAPSPTLGIGVHVLYPGDTPGMYHAEDQQEGFLVLQGECVAVVEGQERRLRRSDYLHCPPGTAHITIGAQGGPCALLMVGTRSPDKRTRYLPDPVAARHGAAFERVSDSAAEVYAGEPPIEGAPSPWPLRDGGPHPAGAPDNAAERFLAASRAHDVDAAAAQLAPDVVMLTPASDDPVVGRDAVAGALRAVEAACDAFRHTHLLADTSPGPASVFGLVYEARIGEQTLGGVDLVELDERDRISRFTVSARPVAALMALGARMAAE